MLRHAALLAALALSLSAQTATRPFPQASSDLPPDPAARFGALPNGVRYVFLPNAEPADRASLRLLVLGGSQHETDPQQGLAHFLEHMAFNGSRNFPPGELIQYFQRIGMGFGNDTNAYTTFDHTAYQLELPKGDAESLRPALTALADYAGGLLLLEEEVNKERGVILSEMRDRDSPGLRAFRERIALLLPGSRIAQRLPIGTEATVRAADAALLRAFYDTWYRPERLAVVVVGHVDALAAENLLHELFGTLEARAPAPADVDVGPVVLAPAPAFRLHRDVEADGVTVILDGVAAWSPEPDTRARRILEARRDLAARIVGNRLALRSRADGSPIRGGSASIGDAFDITRIGTLEVAANEGRWEDAVRLAEQELRRSLEFPFTAEEFATVAAEARRNARQNTERAATRRSPALAGALVQTLANNRVFTHPETEEAVLTEALEGLDPVLLHGAWVEAWKDAVLRVLVTGNLPEGLDDARLAETFFASAAEAVAAEEERATPPLGYAPGEPVPPSTAKHVADHDIHLLAFANGVRLALKSTDFEANQVRVQVRLGHGRRGEPAGLNGLALLADTAFLDAGLGRHDFEELRRILAPHAVTVGFTVADDSLVFNATAAPADLPLALAVVTAYITDPGFREDGFRLAAQQLLAFYNEVEVEPRGRLALEFDPALAGGDPRLGLPPRAATLARTREEVVAWLRPQLAQGPVDIAVVGAATPEAIVQAVGATLGNLPARGPAAADPAWTTTGRAAPGTVLTSEHVTSATPRAFVSVGWLTEDLWDIGRTRRLSVLATILQNRLNDTVREALGDTYSPYAVHSASETYAGFGSLDAGVEAAPERTAAVREAILKAAADVAAGNITQDELDRAVRPILTGIIENFRNNGYWLNNVLRQVHERPERLEWPRTLRADFEGMTLDELRALAARYLAQPAVVWETRFVAPPADVR